MQLRSVSFGLALVCLWLVATTADAMTFTYDALGRLSTVTADNGVTYYYCYDAAGNRTSVNTTSC